MHLVPWIALGSYPPSVVAAATLTGKLADGRTR